MGYLNFLPYWAWALAATPIIATIVVPGTIAERMRILGWTALLATRFAVDGVLLVWLSVYLRFLPGILFGVYAPPLVCAVAALVLVPVLAPRWRHWPASRLDRFELALYAWLILSTAICVVLIPGPFATSKAWIGIDPTMAPAWGIAMAVFGLVAVDLLPTAPRAGLAVGAVFFLVQAFGYMSFVGREGGWHLGNGVLSYPVHWGDGKHSAWIDLVAAGSFVAFTVAAVRRHLSAKRPS